MDALCIAKAADIDRRDMFDTKSKVNGYFPPQCQENVIPSSLKALVDMVLQAPSIKSHNTKISAQQALTISRLILFNSVKYGRSESKSGKVRHHSDRC